MKIFIFLLLIPFISFAEDSEIKVEAATDVEKESDNQIRAQLQERYQFNPRASHWVSTFGFEGVKYELPFDFTGEKKSFDKETRELWGGRLGFGGELHLGAGIHTATKVEGFYVGTLFTNAKTADPGVGGVEVASTKDSGHIYGAEAVQTLSFMFDFKTKNPFLDEMVYITIEPFIEAGLGKAKAYNRKRYFYDTGPGVGTFSEEYNHRMEDEITTTRIGGGFNFIATTGYFLYLKATQYNYDITERKSSGMRRPDGQAPVSFSDKETSVDSDPITVYSFGGGYKF